MSELDALWPPKVAIKVDSGPDRVYHNALCDTERDFDVITLADSVKGSG